MLDLSIILVKNQFVKLLDPHCSEDTINVKFKMSITSSTIASRDHDVPSAKIIFRDKLCLVTITRRDDTPMDASSISEEDIIKICIMKGHTHPLGVLCYSTTESVVLFHLLDELQHATHRIIKMTEFRGEAITVRAMAPLEAHVTVYLAMLHTNPQMGRESCIHLPNKLPQVGKHHIISKQNLETLPTMSCISLWKTSCRKLCNVEYTCPPAIPLQMNGYTHQAVESLRRMTRRSPFQEGEGGVHQGNPLHLQRQSDWLEEGFPLDHPCKCHALLHPGQIWGN